MKVVCWGGWWQARSVKQAQEHLDQSRLSVADFHLPRRGRQVKSSMRELEITVTCQGAWSAHRCGAAQRYDASRVPSGQAGAKARENMVPCPTECIPCVETTLIFDGLSRHTRQIQAATHVHRRCSWRRLAGTENKAAEL